MKEDYISSLFNQNSDPLSKVFIFLCVHYNNKSYAIAIFIFFYINYKTVSLSKQDRSLKTKISIITNQKFIKKKVFSHSNKKMLVRNKLTVIVLMTVFLLTVNGQYHDWYQDYWHMNDWNHNMGNNNMDPFNMDSMLSNDNNNIHN